MSGAATRLPFTFVGTASVSLELAPSEFAGMGKAQVTAAVLQSAREIAPQVDFWGPDIEAAAAQLCEANEASAESA